MAAKTKKQNSEFSRLGALTKRQLAEETAKYDKEFAADGFNALDEESKKQWKRFKRKVGRPKVGAGAVRVSVSMERGLLKAVDRLAKQRDVKRAQLISSALSTLIANEPPTTHPRPAKAKRKAGDARE
ncbi:MAG TPA: hypothetical protein VIK18_08905 [Pirellulales bacterium]